LAAISGADAEKGQVPAAGEGLKMAAGVRHSIDFVERVGKVGDARHVYARRRVRKRIESVGWHEGLDIVFP
jgi:hypothetical protein